MHTSHRLDGFLTLMRREWLQHRIGWLVLMAVPTLLLLAAGLFDGALQIQIDGDSGQMPPLREVPAAVQTAFLSLGGATLTLLLALLSVLFQLPGLARRDRQDRSIEFWLSLPQGHAQSVSATLLMHLLVLPLGALLAGLLGAQLVALVTIVLNLGAMAWLQQPWTALLLAGSALLLRVGLGLVLALAWLSPLLLLTMAASAWLKRWALPAVAVGLLLLVKGLDPRLPAPFFGPALDHIGSQALSALVPMRALGAVQAHSNEQLVDAISALPALLLHDGGQALAAAVSPAMLLTLLLGAAGFALLVYRRQRAG